MVESILLLLWRHLLFYANDARSSNDAVRPDNLALSLNGGMSGSVGGGGLEGSRLAQGLIASLIKSAASLRGVLDRITELDIVSLRRARVRVGLMRRSIPSCEKARGRTRTLEC